MCRGFQRLSIVIGHPTISTADGKIGRTVYVEEEKSRLPFRKLIEPMTVTTLEMVQNLKDNGFTPLQAECIVKQIMHAIEDGDLVTKSFLKAEVARMETNLIKWMIGIGGSAVGFAKLLSWI